MPPSFSEGVFTFCLDAGTCHVCKSIVRMSLSAAKARCIDLLANHGSPEEPITLLTQLVVDGHHKGDGDAAADAISVLFDVACSGSGTEVGVRPSINDGSGGRVGVLVLGFAGSNLTILKPIINMYQQRWPGWKVVATISSGLVTDPEAAAPFAAQCDGVVRALAGCRKILVHCMSNNGQGLQRHPSNRQLWRTISRLLLDLKAWLKA